MKRNEVLFALSSPRARRWPRRCRACRCGRLEDGVHNSLSCQNRYKMVSIENFSTTSPLKAEVFQTLQKKASMHWLTYGMLSHSGAAKRRWSGGAPRRGASAWPAWRRAGAGRRTSGPVWRRGRAGRRAEAAGRRGVGARRRGAVWPRGVAAGVATRHGETAARRGQCRC